MLIGPALLSLALFWHVTAFAVGGVNVVAAYRGLFTGRHDSSWPRAIRAAEAHLWLSGLVVIALASLESGWSSYLSNPKLWAKLAVVSIWLAAALLLRHVAAPKLRAGQRGPMLWVSSVSAACWLYAAFLGVARPLGDGAVSFPTLMAGFAMTTLTCLALTAWLERRRVRAD